MRTMQLPPARGFTLIEILVAVAILAVLGALAVIGYGQYTARAGAADLISRHHDIRTAVIANAATRSTDNCAELVKGYDGSKLADPFATLSYGFEAVAGGYRPVLAVCATAAQSGGVAVARRAHETFAKEGVVEKGAVLTDNLVSFALRLTPADQALCKNPPARPAGDACAGAPPTQAAAQPQAAAAQPAAVQPAAVQPATVQAPAQAPAQPPAQTPAPAQVTAAPDLVDSMPECATDFASMCSEPSIQSMCEKTCASWQPPPPALPHPNSPRGPATPNYVDYNSVVDMGQSPARWIELCRATSPDHSPMHLIDISIDPAFAAVYRSTGDRDWDMHFFVPANSGLTTTMTVTIENASGRNTCTITVAH